jgi:site-specific DNA-methyltransferase (adenine-specific)
MDIDTLYTNDCLAQIKTAKSQSVDLVYMDPPFFSQNTQKSKTRDNVQEYS